MRRQLTEASIISDKDDVPSDVVRDESVGPGDTARTALSMVTGGPLLVGKLPFGDPVGPATGLTCGKRIGGLRAHRCRPINLMGVHHGICFQRCSSLAMEQGQDRRPEGSVQDQGHLGTSSPPPNGTPGSKACTLQPGNRQQAARLRPRQSQGPGHMPRRPGGNPRCGGATQDAAPCAVRVTQATREAAQKWIKQAGLKSEDFVFRSRIHDSPHLGTLAVRPNPRRLGRGTWTRPCGLGDALDAANQGDVDLSVHQEP